MKRKFVKIFNTVRKHKIVFAVSAAAIVAVGITTVAFAKPNMVAVLMSQPLKNVVKEKDDEDAITPTPTPGIEVVVTPTVSEEITPEVDKPEVEKPDLEKNDGVGKENASEITKKEETKVDNPAPTPSSKNEPKGEEPKKEEPKQEEPKKEEPAHTHTWVEQYQEVDNGHWEEVVIEEAWTETKDIYETQWRTLCNGCNKDITNDTTSHGKEEMLKGNTACGAYRDDKVKVKVGTETIEHPAVTEKQWVPKIEKELTGYKCSCGATK